MKIIRKESDRPEWLDQKFVLEITGEELLTLFQLSYSSEGGDWYPKGKALGGPRFFESIAEIIPEKELMQWKDKLRRGRVPR